MERERGREREREREREELYREISTGDPNIYPTILKPKNLIGEQSPKQKRLKRSREVCSSHVAGF